MGVITMEPVTLRVKTNSVPNSIASAIVGMTKEGKEVVLQGIGNGAVGQAVKAVAIANKFVEKETYKFVSEPVFVDLEVEGKERTGLKLILTTVEKTVEEVTEEA